VLLDILGMALLAAGAIYIIKTVSPDMTVPVALMAAGIALIVASSTVIGVNGRRFKKEYEEFERFGEIRKEVQRVPDDLDEGYLIDYTAEPEQAVRFKSNGIGEKGMEERDLPPEEPPRPRRETRLRELFRADEMAKAMKETRLREIDEPWREEDAQFLYPE